MKSTRTASKRPAASARARAGFTLAEVLAALVFMAIVIPVAVEAVRVAARAGEVGERKAAAARIADRVMNELLVTGTIQQTSQSGSVQEGTKQYDWTMSSEQWTEDAMSLVTVSVTFSVQGQDFDASVSTLYDTAQSTTTTSTTTTSASQ